MKKIILFTVLGAVSVFGQAYWKVPNTSALLEDATSWTAGVVPGAGTGVTFNAAADCDVFSHTGLSYLGNISMTAGSGTVSFGLDTGTVLSGAGFQIDGNGQNNNALRVIFTNGTFGARGHFQIGTSRQHSNNWVMVSGPNASLVTDNGAGAGYDVSCGQNGSGNTLIVTNGASVIAYRSVGVGTTRDAGRNGSNNTIRITGTGTKVQSKTDSVMIGQQGAFNEMIVEKGALLVPGGIRIGYTSPLGNQNRLTVRDGGFVTNLAATCYVGDYGYQNEMIMENPGTEVRLNVVSAGNVGVGNRLIVRDGAFLSAYKFAAGWSAGSFGNSVLVTDPGTKVETRGDDVMVGQPSGGNSMVVSNGAAVACGRNFYVGKSQANNLGSDSNRLWITGNGSLFTCPGYMYMGGTNGIGNEIRISDGGKLMMTNTQYQNEFAIGYGTNTFNNRLIVESGGVFTNQINLTCGRWGSMNEIVVRNGGKYTSTASAYIGNYAAASGNRLVVTNGGEFAVNGHVYIGMDPGTSLNEVLVAGVGTFVRNRDFDMDIGKQGNDNRMTIRDGASVSVARGLFIGSRDANLVGSNNVLRIENGTVAVAGSYNGDSNGRLQVSNAGRVELAGTNSVLTTRYDLDLMRGATLVMEIAKEGLLQTPVQIGRSVVATNGTAQLRVSAAPWVNRTGGTLTLLSCASASATALNQLVASAIAADDTLTGKLTVAVDGKSILFMSPRRGGTILRLM